MTVEPKAQRQTPYHHGNLPMALLDAALALLEEAGIEALTLRAVARRVGVTHAAPYRHFKDKSALLAALAEACMVRLVAQVRERRLTVAEGAPQTRAVASAYLRFATTHPALYRVMFSEQACGNRQLGECSDATLLQELNAALQLPAGVAADGAAHALWALCHGLAQLAIAGRGQAAAASDRPETSAMDAPRLAADAAERLRRGMAETIR